MKSAQSKTGAGVNNSAGYQPFFGKGGGGIGGGNQIQARPSFFETQQFSRHITNGGDIQTKLTIGQPNDKYEREADSMADQVVQGLSANRQEITSANVNTDQSNLGTPACSITSLVQAKCASCEREEKLQKKEAEGNSNLEKGLVQNKPIFESNAAPEDENDIQRKCEACEKEEKNTLQSKTEGGGEQHASSSIETSLNASKGSGHSIPADTRAKMENSFGADFSDVRIHNDSGAAQLSEGLHAQAFTHGSDIYFNSGKYDTNSNSGKHLLAHELAHTIQQGHSNAALGAVQRSCGAAGIGEPDSCELAPGNVQGPRYLFKVDCDEFARGNDLDLEKDAEKIQDNATVEVHGFASAEGNAAYNQRLSCARAMAAKSVVEKVLLKQRVLANIRIFSHGAQAGNKTVMRGVTVLINNPAPRTALVCPPPKGFQATSLDDYVDLIKCVETSTKLDNRNVLALLRQMYYGKSWSATSTTDLWDKVITCNVNPGDPRKLLDPDLFEALHRSVNVPGVAIDQVADVGHLFTGLESMMCPSTKVKIDNTPIASDIMDDIANVEMSNEDFSTWGGDLGASVAAMAACWYMDPADTLKTDDCKGADMMKGLLAYIEIEAPNEDLEGDIMPFVLRANANGIPCAGSAGKPLTLSGPISQLFVNYLTDKKSGSGHIDRYKCFAEMIGAIVINGKIQNKDALVAKFYDPVQEFAKTYYVKIMKEVHGPIPLTRIVPHGISMQSININTPLVIQYFLAWLERRMKAAP